MARTKLKVNAKSFVRDFRAGASDSKLMDSYNLSGDGLNTLLKMLVDKKLLHPSELRSGGGFPSTELLDVPGFGEPAERNRPKAVYEPRREPMAATVRTPEEPPPETKSPDPADSSHCPQCGAEVTGKMLICPECGHVLPGEERWANVEPKQRLVDRIPPKVLGTVVALPIAVLLIFVFKDIIIPMTENSIENRTRAAQAARPSALKKAGLKEPRAPSEPREALNRLVADLIETEVFADVNRELTVFHVGPRWWRMSGDERMESLDRMRTAMRESEGEFEVEIVDSMGAALAWVNHGSVELAAQE